MRAKVGLKKLKEEKVLSLLKFRINKADMINVLLTLLMIKKLKVLRIFVMNRIEMVCVSFILKRDATPNVG
jgi:hypothetical protein